MDDGNDGNIEITEHRNNLGMIERTDYKWTGGPIIEVGVSTLMRMGAVSGGKNVVRIGPYRLKILDSYGLFKLIKTDYPFWWVLVLWHRINKTIVLIYSRFIVTLAVWNLADFREGANPSYKDIHIVKRIKPWIKQ